MTPKLKLCNLIIRIRNAYLIYTTVSNLDSRLVITSITIHNDLSKMVIESMLIFVVTSS